MDNVNKVDNPNRSSPGRILFGTPYMKYSTALAAMTVPIRPQLGGTPIGVETAVFDLTSMAQTSPS